jgi:hypothetical protein
MCLSLEFSISLSLRGVLIGSKYLENLKKKIQGTNTYITVSNKDMQPCNIVTWSFPLATIIGRMQGLASVIVNEDMITGWKSKILRKDGTFWWRSVK